MRPLIFIHGSGDNASVWHAQHAYFRRGKEQVVALDLPGHGSRPDTLPYETNVLNYAQATYSIIKEELGLQQPVVVGHSLGGAIALTLAAMHGPELAGLVLVGSGARLRVHPALLEEARSTPVEACQRLTELALTPAHITALAPSLLGKKDPNDRNMLYRDLSACNTFDIMAQLPEITLPTLIICGEEDRLTPPKYSTYLQQHLSRSTLRILPDAGHYVMYEQPEATNQAIAEWLQTIEDEM
ncbi:alpha/beta fold hydrolase [Ktedonospora formicarum]|uniref:Alpha/beta hydrolase n=1 Tax=Ktedonospora formicarum TaxID=2778364 RepID=A0A8J3HWL5_9CHLR|nr:alpha/beta hydrolase [Ktedonospora formicarum]GHO45437.1 alpha/beta hydrolase [Ktedonospora formicarum]